MSTLGSTKIIEDPAKVRTLKNKVEALQNWYNINKEGEFETCTTGGSGGTFKYASPAYLNSLDPNYLPGDKEKDNPHK